MPALRVLSNPTRGLVYYHEHRLGEVLEQGSMIVLGISHLVDEVSKIFRSKSEKYSYQKSYTSLVGAYY